MAMYVVYLVIEKSDCSWSSGDVETKNIYASLSEERAKEALDKLREEQDVWIERKKEYDEFISELLGPPGTQRSHEENHRLGTILIAKDNELKIKYNTEKISNSYFHYKSTLEYYIEMLPLDKLVL